MPKLSKTDYNTIHKWVGRNYKKLGKCFYCNKKKRTEWSNIDHKYSLIESEWQEVCRQCHASFDKLMNKKRPKTTKSQHKRIGNSTLTCMLLDQIKQRVKLKA